MDKIILNKMTLNKIRTRLKIRIWDLVKQYFYEQRMSEVAFVQNINNKLHPDQKKAIVCYTTLSYFTDVEGKMIAKTQGQEILVIVKLLSKLGYSIDIVDGSDIRALKFLGTKKLDLIFGFGEAFYTLSNSYPDAISILYMTEHHPKYSELEESKRLNYYYSRHKKHWPLRRSGMYYQQHHLAKKYSHIITLSEVEPYKSQYQKPFTIFPTGIFNEVFEIQTKNHCLTRKHFLWLGSYGVVHKGLDLLIEIFEKREDISLHIAGISKDDRKYIRIPKKSNIFDHGHINIRSDYFLHLTQQCTYIILPSCSEACATSITTGMLHGLIPIVMKDAGFNRLKENAIFLEDFKMPHLNKKIGELANKPVEHLESMSKQIFAFAHENFSLSMFEDNFKEILTEILNNND